MPELDRRSMMMLSGVGLLSAVIPMPKAGAAPTYVFEDNFDGPAGSAPDPAKWAVSKARETMQDPTFWELPENVGQYRDDRRNVYLDGKSNLVIKAFKEGPTYYGGKIYSLWEGGVGYTWEARVKFECLTPGAWPAYWLSSDQDGEIDIIEWYGNGNWPSATTVHAKANGSEWETHNVPLDTAWHTWRVKWDQGGMQFWQDYKDGAAPYFTVSKDQMADWPFNNPGYKVFPIFNLAVAGSGGGDPSGGTYPCQMLVDYIRVW
jgi:hypothetical protein